LHFERDLLGWWRLDRSPRVRASESSVHTLVDAIRFMKAEAFLDDLASLEASTVTMNLEAGTPPVEVTIRLDRSVDGSWRASGPDQPGQVLVAGSDLVDQIGSDDGRWTESRLLLIRPTQLEGLTAALDGATMTAARTVDGWSDQRASAVLVAIEAGTVRRDGDIPEAAGDPTGRIDARQAESDLSLTFFQTLGNGDRVATETGTTAPVVVEAGTMSALGDALRQRP
jgi:hypothetical protein